LTPPPISRPYAPAPCEKCWLNLALKPQHDGPDADVPIVRGLKTKHNLVAAAFIETSARNDGPQSMIESPHAGIPRKGIDALGLQQREAWVDPDAHVSGVRPEVDDILQDGSSQVGPDSEVSRQV
jgi:hypothetical protein